MHLQPSEIEMALAHEEYLLDTWLSRVREKLRPFRAHHGEMVLTIFVNHYADAIKLHRVSRTYGMWRSIEGMLLSRSPPRRTDSWSRCRYPLLFVSKGIHALLTEVLKECTLELLLENMGVGAKRLSRPTPTILHSLFPKRNGFIKTHPYERSIFVKTSDDVLYCARVEWDHFEVVMHLDTYTIDHFLPWLESPLKNVEYSCSYPRRDVPYEQRQARRIDRVQSYRYVACDELEPRKDELMRLKLGFEDVITRREYTLLLGVGIDMLRRANGSHSNALIQRVTTHI